MADKKTYLYGPVPSRRLGRSLGVDIVPYKTCTLNCVYCQLGRTARTTTERKEYVPVGDVLAEIQNRLDQGIDADFITIGGSGEPTLHSRLGEIIHSIKKMTKIPVAVLTNGTLLYRPDVRADCVLADVVLPSLDAADEPAFSTVNRPHPDLSVNRLIDGLCEFRKQYHGRIWLEVFLIEDFNTDNRQIRMLKAAIDRIRPDKVHLNTAVRPAAEPGISKVAVDKLQKIAETLGPRCEVIADFVSAHCGQATGAPLQTLLSMLKRRPCSLDDITSSLKLSREQAEAYIRQLAEQRLVCPEEQGGVTFYRPL